MSKLVFTIVSKILLYNYTKNILEHTYTTKKTSFTTDKFLTHLIGKTWPARYTPIPKEYHQVTLHVPF